MRSPIARCPALVAGIVFIQTYLGSPSALAQSPCDELAHADSQEKILLDDIRVTPSSDSAVLTAKLHNEIRNLARSMESRFPTLRLSAIRCPGRRPSEGDFSDHDQVLFLYVRGALLEVWGSLDMASHQGLLWFAIVPLRLSALRAKLKEPLGLSDVSVGRKDLRDSLHMIAPLFLELGLGVKAFENGQYPQALGHLCTSHSILRRRHRELNGPRYEALGDYLTEAIANTARHIAQQTGPVADAIKLLASDPCGVGP